MPDNGPSSNRSSHNGAQLPGWLNSTDVSRRGVLRASGIGAMLAGAGGLLAACGGSGSPSSSNSAAAGATGSPSLPATSSSGAAGAPKRGGTLRLGVSGGGTSEVVNPLIPVLSTDYLRIPQLFDALVEWDPTTLKVVPALAESMESNSDATMWTIKLRSGVTFHDGKDLTADDVIYTFQKILDKKSPGYGAESIERIDIANIKKVDKLTVQIPCSRPFSTLEETLPAYYYRIIPTGFDPKKPIGTGPFSLTSFNPGQQSVMDRNANYWNQPYPYVDQLIMIDFPDETSQVNALSSGQVDAIDLLSATSANAVKSRGAQVVWSNGRGIAPWTMRVDQEPFTDVRVRQAMRLLVDRKQIIDVVYGGHGSLDNDIFAYGDPVYNVTLPQRHQDIDKAKSLLKAAGHSGLKVELVVAPEAAGALKAATLFKEQASQAGVTINLRQITSTAWQNNYLKWNFANTFWLYNSYFPQVGNGTLPNSPFNETHFDNQKYSGLYQEALKSTELSKRVEIAHQMQTIDYNTGGYIIPNFTPLAEGLSKKVHGDKPSEGGLPFNNANIKLMWMD